VDYKKYSDAFFDYVPPKEHFHSQFNQSFDMNIDVAPNVFDDIQHEVTYGKKDFQYITGRVDAYISISNAPKLGDDYKNFIFSNTVDKMFVGKLFKWKNSYWLAINTDNLEAVGNSCVVRRCNNMLRWIDKKGNLIKEPCIMADTIKQSNDYSGDKLTIISGFTNLFCQKNENTNTIISNQRFLFGTPENRKAFRVFGDGVKNYLNSETENDMSASMIELTIGGSMVFPYMDDIENGVANRFVDDFTVEIDDVDFNDLVGFYRKLTATAKKDGIAVASAPFIWSSSDPTVASIDEEGNVELLKLGSATITCTLGQNISIKDTITITVVDTKTDVFEVVISPALSGINEGDARTFTVDLYQNDVKTADAFTFSALGTVPSANYTLSTLTGNSFMLRNNQAYYLSPLIIHCVSGTHEKDMSIDLNGAW